MNVTEDPQLLEKRVHTLRQTCDRHQVDIGTLQERTEDLKKRVDALARQKEPQRRTDWTVVTMFALVTVFLIVKELL